MGEYAEYRGGRIKIGTCESMYYLRADQARLVRALPGNVDPVRDRGEIRFRFPFPDEDALKPGSFDDYGRGVRIPGGWHLPAEYEHSGSVQFSGKPGYLLSLPCPEAFRAEGDSFHTDVTLDGGATLRVHRNGFSGGYEVTQQRSIEGEWWTVVDCGSCGHAWRLPPDLAAEVAECFLVEAERETWRRLFDEKGNPLGEYGFVPDHTDDSKRFLLEMGKRILAGYHASEPPEHAREVSSL